MSSQVSTKRFVRPKPLTRRAVAKQDGLCLASRRTAGPSASLGMTKWRFELPCKIVADGWLEPPQKLTWTRLAENDPDSSVLGFPGSCERGYPALTSLCGNLKILLKSDPRPGGPVAKISPARKGWDIDSPTSSERRRRGTSHVASAAPPAPQPWRSVSQHSRTGAYGS